MGSECGCLPVPEERIVKKWRLQPGKMFLVDLEKGRIIDDKELKDSLASASPTPSGSSVIPVKLDEVESDKTTRSSPRCGCSIASSPSPIPGGPQVHHAADGGGGEEPVGSMGNDSPLAVLSNKNKMRTTISSSCSRR